MFHASYLPLTLIDDRLRYLHVYIEFWLSKSILNPMRARNALHFRASLQNACLTNAKT